MNRRRILIVEDEAIIADDLRHNLQELGYEVTGLAMTAAEALALAGSARPDLVLMDITLRGREDGVQAARAIMEKFQIPVVFLSAHADASTLERAGGVLPLGYLVKPFTMETLRATIDTAFYRHVADLQLRQMERWLATTLSSIGDAVVAVDASRRINFFNPAAEQLTGWTRAEAVGSPHAEVVRLVKLDTGEPLADPVERAFATGMAVHLGDGCALHHRAGKAVPITQSAAPIRTEETPEITGVILILRDATAQANAERERRAIEKKMHETQKLESLGLLAGGIAHDFNNLLTAIVGNTEVAESELPRGSPLLEHLDAVKRAARRATDLCRQMLAYAGQGAYFPTRVSLSDLVRNAMPLLRIAVGTAAQVRFHLMEKMPPVSADTAQLQQALIYLVTNAAESFDHGAGVITVTTGLVRRTPDLFLNAVVAPPDPSAHYVFIEVKDNGPGIDPDTLARIWDPFFSTKFAGRGLGLPAVHGIVRTAGGAITVSSQRGLGSTFRIFLPVGATETPAEAPAPLDAARAPEPSTRGWVLIVDDEESIRKLLERTMPHFGLSGVAVSTCEAAIAALQVKPRAELVLMDATMPGVDTAALARTMHATHPSLPIALMSGYIEAHTSSRFKDLKFAAFLQKPFTREEVGRVIAEARELAK